MDERGNLTITDRMKDMFIVGGFNAYPAEIENMLMRAPRRSRQVAVVGVPDERLGEVGMAFVVPRAGATIDADDADRLVPRAHGQLQGAALGRDRRRAPAERQRQGAEVRAARAGGYFTASRWTVLRLRTVAGTEPSDFSKIGGPSVESAIRPRMCQ